MPQAFARYTPAHDPEVAPGWSIERLTAPSRLFGANGLRMGPDGRLYVAQWSGSQISAVDIDSGAVEAISPVGGPIVGPDDLAFDDAGNLYATEITEGRVSMRTPRGETRILAAVPLANPITVHRDRIFAGELQLGGRIVELDREGGPPRTICEGLPMPNAFEVGPDGMLYFPLMGANEIWRVSLDGGEPERVARDLGVPTSVKFDAMGRIVSTQINSGEVLRIDVQTGAREVIAQIAPGMDNLAFCDERLFASNVTGSIHEILGGGRLRSVIPSGFNWPLGLAVNDDGTLYAADGLTTYAIAQGGSPRIAGSFFLPGYPGYCRGLAAMGGGEFAVATGEGRVLRWRPHHAESELIADGFDELYGIAVAADGSVLVADGGTGRVLHLRGGAVEVLASDLRKPKGIAVAGDGSCFVAEADGGRIVRLSGGHSSVVLDGLIDPQGLALHEERLYVVDARAKELVVYDIATRTRETIVSALPVGAPPGVTAKPLRAMGAHLGVQGPFAGIAIGAGGTIYLSNDAEGAILAVHPTAEAGRRR